jgi:RHS repeat-associated protein
MKAKSIVVISIMILVVITKIQGQSTGNYYIQTRNYINEVTDPGGMIENFGDYIESFTYLDGLGRTIQTVNKQISPNQKDFVVFHQYDNFGREPVGYLPYADVSNDGSFKTNVIDKQASFYLNAVKIAHTNFPYSEKVYDGAGRLVQQGAPGQDWQPGDHTDKFEITFNTMVDNIRRWELSSNELYCFSNSVYNNNELIIEISFDENNNKVKKYNDGNGLTVATETADNNILYRTYYIYDDFERLKFKIPPKAVEKMGLTGNWNTSTLINDLIYVYYYNSKNQIFRLKVPGKEVIDYIYDNLERVVMTQDGNLRSQNKCMFTKYDILGRVVMTGICYEPIPDGYSSLQEYVESYYANSEGYNYEKYIGVSPTCEHGYTNQSYPILSASDEILSVSYYDSYDFVPSGFRDEYQDVNGFENQPAKLNIGRATGSKLKILDNTNTWLYSIVFYDDRDRVIQTYRHNQFQSGFDEMTLQYDFTGKVIKFRQVQTGIIDGTSHLYNIESRLVYDHAGRLIQEFQSINEQAEVMIKQLYYNELGQVIDKKLHSTNQGQSFLQSIDYKYNIRGWLTNINQSNLLNDYHFITADENLAAMEVVNTLNINNLQIEIDLLTRPTRLQVKITDNKKLTVTDESTSASRDVGTSESEIFTFYPNVRADSAGYYTLKELNGKDYFINFANMEIDQAAMVDDIISQTTSVVTAEMEDENLSNSDQLNEINLLVCRHLLNSLGIEYFNQESDDLFGMDILYQQGFSGLNGTPQFNGVVSGIKWQVKGNNPGIRGYGFQYDDHYQLTDAKYAKQGMPHIWNLEVDRFSEKEIGYDANGNITQLKRYGVIAEQNGQYVHGLMDNLTYQYYDDGNQLKVVQDAFPDPSFIGNDFRDNTSTGSNEYTYDANGNMITDANKGITVTYNHLNLPVIVDFGSNKKIQYLYSAAGTRIKKTVITGSTTVTQHYAGNIVYNGSQLEYILTSEGRIRKEGTQFKYEYFIKDHLGNVRVIFGKGANGLPQILQEDHYYPFGLTYMGALNYNYGTQENKLLFQSKELQDEHNLQWHDFGARMYDAQLGRWHSPDPMLQYSSPYLAMGNSPTNGTDPSGMWFDRIKGHSSRGLDLYKYMSYMRDKGYRWDGRFNSWHGPSPGVDNTGGVQGGYDISDMVWGDSDAANTEARNWHKMKMVETTLRKLITDFYASLVETQEENTQEWLDEFEKELNSALEDGGYGASCSDFFEIGEDGDPEGDGETAHKSITTITSNSVYFFAIGTFTVTMSTSIQLGDGNYISIERDGVLTGVEALYGSVGYISTDNEIGILFNTGPITYSGGITNQDISVSVSHNFANKSIINKYSWRPDFENLGLVLIIGSLYYPPLTYDLIYLYP